MRVRDLLIRGVRWTWPLPLVMAAVVLVAEVVPLGGRALERTAITMIINLIVVVGLYTFVGMSGVFSFGHISFMAVGAYTTAILSIPVQQKEVLLPLMPGPLRHVHVPDIAAILLGGLVAALVALVVAVPLSRLSGLVAALATFAFLLIVNTVASAWTEITNGTTGMTAIPESITLTRALLFALGAIALAFVYQQSRFGRRLRATREDEIAARAVGANVGLERGLALVLSGFVVGIAGGVYAQYLGSIDPSAFFLQLTFLTIAMLVVGGLTSLSGAVTGAIAIATVAELLRRVESGFDVGSARIEAPAGLQEVGLGLFMVGILLLRPRGITNGKEIPWPMLSRFPLRGGKTGLEPPSEGYTTPETDAQ